MLVTHAHVLFLTFFMQRIDSCHVMELQTSCLVHNVRLSFREADEILAMEQRKALPSKELCMAILVDKMHDLRDIDAYDNIPITFPPPTTPGQVVPLVEWYKMERRGKGWSVMSCHSELGRVECPVARAHLPDNLARQDKLYNTLSKLKLQFAGVPTTFHCVVNGHFTAPSTIYQLIILDISPERQEQLVAAIQKRNQGQGNDYDFHCELPWVSNIPPSLYAEWNSY